MLTHAMQCKEYWEGRWIVGIEQGTVESGKPEMMISFPAGSSSSGTFEQMSEITSSGNGYKSHPMKGGRGNLGQAEKWR